MPKLFDGPRQVVWSHFQRLRDRLRRAGSRLSTLVTRDKLDPAAAVIVLISVAQVVRLTQAAGWLPMPKATEQSWDQAAAAIAAGRGFWISILDPARAAWWLGSATLLIFLGIVAESRRVMMGGTLLSVSWYGFVTASVCVHLGLLACLPWLAIGLSSVWVFDDVYRRRQERTRQAQSVDEATKLVAAVTELYEKGYIIPDVMKTNSVTNPDNKEVVKMEAVRPSRTL